MVFFLQWQTDAVRHPQVTQVGTAPVLNFLWIYCIAVRENNSIVICGGTKETADHPAWKILVREVGSLFQFLPVDGVSNEIAFHTGFREACSRKQF